MARILTLLEELRTKLRDPEEDEETGPTEVLEQLIAAGWDPDSVNASGRSLLHELAGNETLDPFKAANAIEWLLDYGVNINLQDRCGVTPLHLAALTGFGIVDSLLERGADKALRTTRPATATLYAARGTVTIPSDSTAYDLAQESDLPEDVVQALCNEPSVR